MLANGQVIRAFNAVISHVRHNSRRVARCLQLSHSSLVIPVRQKIQAVDPNEGRLEAHVDLRGGIAMTRTLNTFLLTSVAALSVLILVERRQIAMAQPLPVVGHVLVAQPHGVGPRQSGDLHDPRVAQVHLQARGRLARTDSSQQFA